MSIGKIEIDFNVLSPLDPKILVLCDNSNWLTAEDKPAYISITPPGSSKAITNIFSKHKVSTFNSTNLQLISFISCSEQGNLDLPDGVWKICLQSSYDKLEKTKYHLKTDRFLVEWYKEYVNFGL